MKFITLLLTVLILSSCAHNHNDPSKTNVEVTKTLKGHSYGNIYFTAQPNEEELKSLKDNGFVAVVNLRGKKEKNYSEKWEKDIVTNSGINYYNVALPMKREITDADIDAITEKVVANRSEGKILVHCSSGNRVGIWLGAHFKKDHGLTSDEALEKAKSMGLDKPKAEKKLRSYLYK